MFCPVDAATAHRHSSSQDETQLSAAVKEAKDNLEIMRRQVRDYSVAVSASPRGADSRNETLMTAGTTPAGFRVRSVPARQERDRAGAEEAMTALVSAGG